MQMRERLQASEPETRNPAALATPVRALLGVAALLAFALSVVLFFGGDEKAGIFVAIWVPSILALGAFVAPRQEAARLQGMHR